MSATVPEKSKISHFLVFYLVSSMQIGIGVLGFQRVVAMTAGYDGWISVLIAGLSIHIIIWMMYKIAESTNGDLVDTHTYLLGNILGKTISFLFLFYFTLLASAVLRTYVEIIQVWMFPELPTFWFALAFLILTIYIIYGGFRTVTGIAFFCTILPSYLILTFGYTIPFSNYENILPILDHKLSEILMTSRDMSLTYLGYETLMFYYPYIKDAQKSKKWAHLAILSTTILYTVLALITFGYFSEKQLEKTVWATLSMWKIVQLPFVERFEYIGIANWNLIVLPNICIAVWCASRILKRTVNIKQKKGVIIIAFLCLVAINFFTTRDQINKLNDITGKIGFYLNYVYIPSLFTAVLIAKKVRKK
jgi:spore germination protein AB